MHNRVAGLKSMGFVELAALAACLVQTASATSNAVRQDESEIRLFQWNPHWECSAWNVHDCGRLAQESLNGELISSQVDFANIVELASAEQQVPAGWTSIRRKCGIDVIDLIYSNSRWVVPDDPAASASGCMDNNDRPFLVQQFDERLTSSGWGRRIIVVAAHYPHNKARAALRGALATVIEATGVQGTVLIADTNEYSITSNDRVMRDINVPGDQWVSTDLRDTCCWNNGDAPFAPGNTYDRIIANFGQMISTEVLPMPDWGKTGEFHRAVRGVLRDAPDDAMFALTEADSDGGDLKVCAASETCDGSCSLPGGACSRRNMEGHLFGQAGNCVDAGCGDHCQFCPQCSACCCADDQDDADRVQVPLRALAQSVPQAGPRFQGVAGPAAPLRALTPASFVLEQSPKRLPWSKTLMRRNALQPQISVPIAVAGFLVLLPLVSCGMYLSAHMLQKRLSEEQGNRGNVESMKSSSGNEEGATSLLKVQVEPGPDSTHDYGED